MAAKPKRMRVLICPVMTLVVGISAVALGTARAASINDVFAGIAGRVPEFAGVHIDEQQDVLYIHLRNGNPAAARAALAELKTAFGDPELQQSKVQAVPATFGFEELKSWHDQMALEVLQRPGVTLMAIDHANNRIVIGVEDAGARSKLEHDLHLLGSPREAVIFMETGPVKPLATSLGDPQPRMLGGLEIAYQPLGNFCTLGFVAKRAGTFGFITASHCSRTLASVDKKREDVYTQGGSPIGVEMVDPPFRPCHCLLPFGLGCLNRCRPSDSAFIQFNPGILFDFGSIAQASSSSQVWDGVSTFRITGSGAPFVGKSVTKVGATTGRTDGRILLGGVTVNVNFHFLPSPISAIPPFTRLLVDQVLATMGSNGGDSGGAIIHVTGTDTALLEGILYGSPAGLTLYAPIRNVQADLGPLQFVGAVAPPAGANPKPDLVATSPDNLTGFCRVVGNQLRVIVRVVNLGGTPAPASTTRVDFGSIASFPLPTPGIPAGGFADLIPVEPPSGCFHPDCGFSITVDSTNSIDEGAAGETNNTVVSDCVG
jgi:hypothetical protein